jgi:LmbE family N-acetylglucosaminyl deacetylase
MDWMKLGRLVLWSMWCCATTLGQTPQVVQGPDERFKVDILVVVAHPDDEGSVTPYLARAIYDLHKRVAIVYATRGGSGGNEYSREHGPALANIREMEAREACARIGVTNVWFLDGKDTASQNVLNSLANWGHGANLEKIVGIFRLTQPEVVISWLPGIFIGENHGDHQASGVLATEAFDLSGDPEVFPAQVAGASKRLEPYLENVTPWQAKKIYFFSDARDEKQFVGKGPSYSIKEISPSQKKPYWRLALDAAIPYETQFSKEIQPIAKLSDEQIEKMMSDPNTAWWSDPETLIFGKAAIPNTPTEDVFAGIKPGPLATEMHAAKYEDVILASGTRVSLGGPWRYYGFFRSRHGLLSLPMAAVPEIGIKAGTTLSVPLVIQHADPLVPLRISLKIESPAGWKVTSGAGEIELPAEASTAMRVEIDSPALSPEELKKPEPQEIVAKSTCECRYWWADFHSNRDQAIFWSGTLPAVPTWNPAASPDR